MYRHVARVVRGRSIELRPELVAEGRQAHLPWPEADQSLENLQRFTRQARGRKRLIVDPKIEPTERADAKPGRPGILVAMAGPFFEVLYRCGIEHGIFLPESS